MQHFALHQVDVDDRIMQADAFVGSIFHSMVPFVNTQQPPPSILSPRDVQQYHPGKTIKLLL